MGSSKNFKVYCAAFEMLVIPYEALIDLWA